MTRGSTNHEITARIESRINDYLACCYRQKSVARVSELAQFLGVSRSFLALTAKRMIGMSAKAALQVRQLSRAADLLRSTSASVDEVCTMAAFGDRRTFYRVFRRHTGTSPSRFREWNTKCP